MDQPQHSFFLRLPAEIRNEIYAYYIEDLQQRYLKFGMVTLNYTDHIPIQLDEVYQVANNLLICHQFYAEALDYFFKHVINRFVIHFDSLPSFSSFMRTMGTQCPNFKGVLCIFLSSTTAGIDPVLFKQVKRIVELIEKDASPRKPEVHRSAKSEQHVVTLDDEEGHVVDAEWVDNKREESVSWCRFRLHLSGHLGHFPCTKEIPNVLAEW